MWCKSCRQEVPGHAAPGGKGFCCARCHELIPVENGTTEAEPAVVTERVDSAVPAALDSTLPEYWAWQVNQQLRHAEQVIQSGRRRQLPTGQQLRIDEAWDKTAPAEMVPAATHVDADGDETPLTSFAWFVICTGVTALTCGSVLMGLSFWQERPELWTVGLPIMIIGQVALVLGMGLQLVARTRAEEKSAAQSETLTAPLGTTREPNRSTQER